MAKATTPVALLSTQIRADLSDIRSTLQDIQVELGLHRQQLMLILLLIGGKCSMEQIGGALRESKEMSAQLDKARTSGSGTEQEMLKVLQEFKGRQQ
jgi:hypothetical protein